MIVIHYRVDDVFRLSCSARTQVDRSVAWEAASA